MHLFVSTDEAVFCQSDGRLRQSFVLNCITKYLPLFEEKQIFTKRELKSIKKKFKYL